MLVEVNQHTLADIARDYEAAVAWMNEIGFAVEQGRLTEYRRAITGLLANFDSVGWGNLEELKQRQRVFTTLLEVRDLISIHRGLRNTQDGRAAVGLGNYLKGPFSPVQELATNSSNRARNVGFELFLNALFTFAGMNPKYGSQADLSFEHMEQDFFVEAKRPMNASGVAGVIKDANKQLTRRLKDLRNHQARGLLAIDLTKVINPENRVMSVSNKGHLQELMYNEDRRQIHLLGPSWQRGRHRRTLGAMLHYRLLTSFADTGALNTLRWIGFVHFESDSVMADINCRLENAIEIIC